MTMTIIALVLFVVCIILIILLKKTNINITNNNHEHKFILATKENVFKDFIDSEKKRNVLYILILGAYILIGILYYIKL